MSEFSGEPFNPYGSRKQSTSRKVIKTNTGMNFNVDKKYSFIKCIGEGSYGVVISVTDTTNNNMYAIKKIPHALKDVGNGFRVYREIMIMKHCHHENVLGLINVEVDPPETDFSDLYITMELMETDLSRVIYSKQELTDDHVLFFTYQILCGLKYLHSANIIHRDMKPSNILLNSNCDLKICDFNLARDENVNNGLTEYVQTRWYRAPEVMLSSQHYTKSVDVWSVGCIMGELLKRDVLFKGTNYLNQIKLYCDLLGAPDETELDFITNTKGQRYVLALNRVPCDLKIVFPNATDLCLDLLSKMLVINPKKRIDVIEALAHPYFDEIRDELLETRCNESFVLGTDDESISRTELRVSEIEKMRMTV